MDNNKRIEQFDKIVNMGNGVQKALKQYWLDYSLYASFEYWLMVFLLIVPLIVLFFKIDKDKLFFMGFYGYSVHILFGHIDEYATNAGFLNYPFPVIPMLPGFSLETSFIPVTFLLVYQWTLNHKKNYYVYITLTSLILAFMFKPLLVALGLFRLYGNTHYFHLFIIYFIIALLAKFITNVFLWTEKNFQRKY